MSTRLTKEEAIAKFGAEAVNKAIADCDWIDAGFKGNYRLYADYPYLADNGKLYEDRVEFIVEKKPWHMCRKMDGDWMLLRGDETILDDSACEDYYGDAEMVKSVFEGYVSEYYTDESEEITIEVDNE